MNASKSARFSIANQEMAYGKRHFGAHLMLPVGHFSLPPVLLT